MNKNNKKLPDYEKELIKKFGKKEGKEAMKKLQNHKKSLIPTFIRLAKDFNKDAKLFHPALFLAFLRAILFTAGTWFVGKAVDIFFNPTVKQVFFGHQMTPDNKLSFFWITMGVLIGIFVIYCISAVVQMRLMVIVSNNSVNRFRQQAFANLQKMHIDYYDTRPSGNMISILSNDIDNMEMGITQGLNDTTTSFFNLIFSAVFMLLMSVSLTVISLLIFAILMSFTIVLLKIIRKNFIKQQKRLGDLNTFVEEMISNKKIISSFKQSDNIVDKFEFFNNRMYSSNKKAGIATNLMYPNYSFAASASILSACAIGFAYSHFNVPTWGFDIILGTPTVVTGGFLIGFTGLSWNLTGTINDILTQSSNIILAASSFDRLSELIDLDVPTYSKDLVKLDENIDAEIEFKNVYFRYDRKSTNFQVKNMSFKVKPGQMVALVGPTGAGKTTIINLLTKFYDIERKPFEMNGKMITPGDIYINGIPYKDINSKNLRNHMSIVLQDTFLFEDTIRNNIKISSPQATDDEILQAVKMAKIEREIMNTSKGFDTMIGSDASNFSKGQNQLLDISRVILSNNNIVVFDEATSNLDTKTEKQVYKAMDKFMKDKTAFVIAHRLSTIVEADMILVIDDGQIIENGTHDQLLTLNGFYANLYNTQMNRMAQAKDNN